MSEIPKTYEPAAIEEKWYADWLANDFFKADPGSKKPAYSIVIPPPNVTGVLTLGHVLNNTIQDILARRARMLGKEVLWLPGTDHAGIATQTVVERTLKKQGIIRHRDDLGREKFLKKVWEWKDKHGGIIIQQLKKLGASCDWSRERFTMDPEYSKCVQRVFVDLYKKGLIYRGKRMVNWCPASLTALSDEEVVMKPQNGTMYHFKVEVVDAKGSASVPLATGHARKPEACATLEWLTIATTRPETIPGDTAVAVNPKDTRYAHLIGKHVRRPLPVQIPDEQKLIPIIGDEHVEFEFGTGVLKVTPAHDKADFEIGQRHGLAAVDIMNPDGTMNAAAGESLVGLDRFEARNVAVDHLRELGVLVKEEPYQNNVGYSERADVPIEPRLSEQWFLKYPSVEKSKAVVADGAMKFYPDRWAKVYDHWLGGIQDWCISRQLWWGHRVPVWYRVEQASGLHRSKAEAGAAFLDPYAEIDITRRNLPHWQQAGRTYFVTFRLADSLPAAKLGELEEERATWLKHNPDPWTEAQRREYYQRFSAKLDEWLDAGSGSCVLRDERAAKIVADALTHFEGARYTLGAWVVMPNHVHALVTPLEGHDLGSILHSWKSFTAHKINELLGREGQLWQHESYDHTVRNEESLWKIGEYIDGNPERAGIKVAQASGLRPGKPEACATIWCDLTPPPDPENWTQDPDVLDTWFSSWLWPFATMGWPEKTDTLAKFYPTTDLVTGPDIIFFWVARMIMAGFEWMGEMPFRNVYFTGIIRDKQGRKMSKSLGNSPDPLDLIATYGADALRFGVMRSAPLGADILFDDKNVELGRNFCTKLWNAARFRQMQGGETEGEINAALLTSDDKWILLRLDAAIGEVSRALDEYRFSDATQALYRFFWSEYCDWYLEASKAAFFGDDTARKANTLAVIDFVLAHTLRLFHPFLPFITEELWHGLGFHDDLPADQGGRTIMFAHWPAAFDGDFHHFYGLDPTAEEAANNKYETVNRGRALRRDANIASNKRVRFILQSATPIALHDSEVLRILLNAEPFEVLENYDAPRGTPSSLTPLGTLFLPLEGLIDVAAERDRLAKEIAKVEDELAKVRAKLANPNFAGKVPPAVLAEHQQREGTWAEKLAQLQRMREALGEG
jgi:valyl-tRNA synthetase